VVTEVSAPSAAAAPLVPTTCAIVGIGASAGGLEAFTQLLTQLPSDSGMAFVLIQHLDPTHKSFLVETLAKATSLPVSQVQHGQTVEADHVYVIPPESDVSIAGGRLELVLRRDSKQLHLPIDFFFTALAAEIGSRAIGVVLSGTASDGTEGLKAIKAAGGITFAQDPGTARYAGMPSSAIAAGVVDFSLPIARLTTELVRLGHHRYLLGERDVAEPAPGVAPSDRSLLAPIMKLIRDLVGVDFGEYKFPTFERRLSRRMALRRVEERATYLEILKREPDEVRALYEDTLIHVSSFFRDPDVFDTLKTMVLPAIVATKAEGTPIRIWVAGCSTGQEVYSLAILVLEFLGDSRPPHPIQLFGSDVSDRAIRLARAGQYSDGGMHGIGEEQRRRYFTKVDSGYRIIKSVRDLCVFVRHDLARDAPFSKIDLLSCRNVLIYFDPGLQRRVISAFHFSLNRPGFLVLGRTEYISGFEALFSAVDKTRKIFARSDTPSTLRFAPRLETHGSPSPRLGTIDDTGSGRGESELRKRLDNLLIGRYAPPGVLVNERLEILQFRGQTGSFLQAASGSPQNNLVKMARPGLLARLQKALTRARELMVPVREEGVEVDQDGFTRTCDIVVLPFVEFPAVRPPDSDGGLFVVMFEEAQGTPPDGHEPSHDPQRVHKRRRADENAPGRVSRLEQELAAITQHLHSVIEDHGRANEDLGAANEELMSGNEELQSLNEELETAKEELQSTNEELTTVNDELNRRNLEVGVVNSDLANLIDTVDIAIVIVDERRHIRRFTPKAGALLNVLPSDVGRRLDDIRPNIEVPGLDRRIADVIATLVADEAEVQDRGGTWYRVQIRPYRGLGGRVDGAIVSFFDIDVLKLHVHEARSAQEQAERADRAKDEFLAVLSHELRTPISALLMQAQLLRRVGADPVKRERACAAIERSTRMQVQLIDDLLDVSRIVTGKMRVDLRPLDLGAVVEAAHETVTALAESKGIQLTALLDRSLGPVAGDRMRLEQVVINLLTNAIKFTPKGGRIEIVLEGHAAGVPPVAGQPTPPGIAHLRIRDNGMGISPDFLPRIFNRLTQQDSSSTRSHAGLGLGLAIVRHLVEAHGGHVRAESRGPGQGATFHVLLPIWSIETESGLAMVKSLPATAAIEGLEPAGMRLSAPSAAGPLVGRRILVVEDDDAIREALAEMLTHVGATVATAASSAEGLAEFTKIRPEAVVCDIAMPGEDGYGFIRSLRARGASEGGSVPAMALTALAGDRDRLRALAEGFQRHYLKPVEADQLVSAVSELLALADGADSARAGSD
jgi:two-component system CheB/CheR fusion protein